MVGTAGDHVGSPLLSCIPDWAEGVSQAVTAYIGFCSFDFGAQKLMEFVLSTLNVQHRLFTRIRLIALAARIQNSLVFQVHALRVVRDKHIAITIQLAA